MKLFTETDRYGIEHPKTHYRKGCKICIETQCGCFLPFRRLKPCTRKLLELERKRKWFDC